MGVETMLWTSDVVKDPWFPLVKDPSEVKRCHVGEGPAFLVGPVGEGRTLRWV